MRVHSLEQLTPWLYRLIRCRSAQLLLVVVLGVSANVLISCRENSVGEDLQRPLWQLVGDVRSPSGEPTFAYDLVECNGVLIAGVLNYWDSCRIYRSLDGGATWTLSTPVDEWTYPHFTSIPRTNIIVAACSSPNYADYYDSEILVSTDQGVSWTPRFQGLPRGRDSIFGAPRIGIGLHAIICGSTGSLYLVTSAYSTGAINPDIYKVYVSRDTGTTWHEASAGLEGKNIITIACGAHDELFATTKEEGVFVSNDHGESWHASNSGLPIKGHAPPAFYQVVCLHGGLVIMNARADWPSLLYGSSDDGKTWEQCASLLWDNPYTVMVNPSDVLSAFASGGSAVCQSTNGGTTWRVIRRSDDHFEQTEGATELVHYSWLSTLGCYVAAGQHVWRSAGE